MRRLLLSAVVLPALLVGCASAGGTGASSASTSARLTSEEIAASDAPTAYDLVDRLRRGWLRRDVRTGEEVEVFMDNRRIGGAEALRQIPVADVAELAFLTHDEAVRRWGTQVTGSVILVTRR